MTNQSTPQPTPPKCEDCRWSEKGGERFYVCTHKKKFYQMCMNERSEEWEEAVCGPTGKNFESKL
jgi:hypothetical protein